MEPNQELSVAKSIIADQQIALGFQSRQLSSAYFLTPSGGLVHAACGKTGLTLSDKGEWGRVCPCFAKESDV